MSKSTIALIIFLSIITAILLVIAFTTQSTPKPAAAPTATPTITPFPAHTQLWFIPSSPSSPSGAPIISPAPLQKGGTYAADVHVNTDVNTISGVQMEVAYDPKVITNVKVTPGTFFTNPNVIINRINTTDGRISYAIALQPGGTPQQGQGVVAIVHYTVLPTATATTTTLSFLPKSFVSVEGTSDTALQTSSDITFKIGK